MEQVSPNLSVAVAGPSEQAVSPDQAPRAITPPATSPPGNMEQVSPDLSVTVAGPSKRAALPDSDSELSELEDDGLVEISNAKGGSGAKIAKKKKAVTKKGKTRKRAVPSEGEGEDAPVTVKPQTQRNGGRKTKKK